MTTSFQYRAACPDGRIVTGRVRAATGAQAAGQLLDRGLEALEVIEEPAEPSRSSVPRRELAVVFRGLATLVGAGVPLERAILAAERLARGPLREALAEARAGLRDGRTLAQALEARGGIMPAIVLATLAAGERAGRLALTLEQVAAQLELEADLVSRLRHALAYPLLLLTGGIAALLVIGTVVVPRFATLLADAGQPLPPATRLLVAASTVLTHDWPLLLAGTVAVATALAAWLRRPDGRRFVHRALLQTPVAGPIRLGLASTRLARALSAALDAGMPLLPALGLAGAATGDVEVAARLSRARDRVAGGESLASALDAETVLSPLGLQLVALGEEGGRLGDMVRRAGEMASAEAERALATAVGVLEPALVVLLGGFVAFVAAALLQAVYGLRPGAV